MNVKFAADSNAFEDFTAWAQEDKRIFKKIVALIKDIQRQPYEGLGKPEELKWELSGYWSRRINEEHRLVYRITDNDGDIEISSCKYHYGKHK